MSGDSPDADGKVQLDLELPAGLAAWIMGLGDDYEARAEAILQQAMDEATR